MASATQEILAQVERARTEPLPDFNKEEELKRFVRPNRWVAVDVGGFRLFRFNWSTTLMASLVLWSMTIAALVDADETKKEWSIWQSWISQNFTWLYIGTQNVWAVFLIWICFSRFGGLKLGKKDEKPEFNDLTWFCMLFTCGIAVGVYYWGVSEPMYYYRASYGNKLWKIPMNNDDDRAQQAMFLTFFHWGLHGFVPYVVVALAIGVVCYRWNLPVTMRSAFYPLLGDLIYSTLGDLIDALSISCTTFGVCTSLGFGVSSILYGVYRLDGKTDPNDEGKKVLVIWIITVSATLSIVAGLKRGIKNLSIITFILGFVLMLAVTFMDNTWFILNVFTQTLGSYLQWIVQVGFDCDAWQQLGYEFAGGESNRLWGSSGDSLLDKVGKMPEGVNMAAFYDSHAAQFMEWWTIFYWGWWISWAPFVGTFMAKVSRGRTVRQLIMGAFFAPVLFSFVWLTVFGSLGIKMQRVCEMRLGVKPDWQNGSVNCTAMGYASGQLIPKNTTGYNLVAHQLADEGYYPIACRNHGDRLFDVLSPYEGMKDFLFVLVVIGVSLYFVTSSDSGSYIDDILAAQGLQDPPVVQKIFWAFTEGACACGLIVAGGDDALGALQAASISAGLPYTFAICFLCTSLYRALKIDVGDEDICNASDFTTSLFDIFDLFKGKDMHTCLTQIAMGFFAPFLHIFEVAKHLYGVGPIATVHLAAGAGTFFSWVGLLCASAGGNDNLAYLGWVFYILLVGHCVLLRSEMREKHNVYGSMLEDLWASLTMLPFVLAQLRHHAENGQAPKVTNFSDASKI